MDSNGLTITDQKLIKETFSSFHKKLFTSSHPADMEFCLQAIQPSVTEAMTQKFLATFFEFEIKEAIFQMKPLGAPGPNGFHA